MGGELKLTPLQVSTVTSWWQCSVWHWKMFGVTLCTSKVYSVNRAGYRSTSTSWSVLWAAGWRLNDVVGVRLSEARGSLLFYVRPKPACVGLIVFRKSEEPWDRSHVQNESRFLILSLRVEVFVYSWDALFISSDNVVTWIHARSLFSNMTLS